MPIENDILSLVQESSKDPSGFTPETAAKVVTRLKQFHAEKKAKAEQRKAQGINSPDEDSDLADYDSKLNDPEYVKEFLPQLLYEESQRIRTPQAGQPSTPATQAPAQSPYRLPGRGEFAATQDPEKATNVAKWIAEFVGGMAPAAVRGAGVGPVGAGIAAAIPAGLSLRRRRKGDRPQDFSTSLMQGLTGAVINRGAGPAAEAIRKVTGGGTGGFNATDLAVGVGSAEANMLLPTFVNDTTGFEIPEGTGQRAGIAALLGGLPLLGKQWLGSASAASGTRTIEDLHGQSGPTLLSEAAKKTASEVRKILQDPDVRRALARQKPAAPPSPLPQGMSVVGPNGSPISASTASATPAPKPPAVPTAEGDLMAKLQASIDAVNARKGGGSGAPTTPPAPVTGAMPQAPPAAAVPTPIPKAAREAAKIVRPFTKGGKTSPDVVSDRVTSALDSLFSSANATKVARADRAANVFGSLGKKLKEIHGGDTQAAKDSVTGYFFKRFFRNPTEGDGIDGAQKLFNAVSGGERLEKMFKEMGMGAKEITETVSNLRKVAESMDKIARIDAMAASPITPSLRGLRASDPGFTAWWNPQHWIERGKPSAVAESVLRGKNPTLPAKMQQGLATWLRRNETSPNQERALSTMLEQMAAANYRDPDKR